MRKGFRIAGYIVLAVVLLAPVLGHLAVRMNKARQHETSMQQSAKPFGQRLHDASQPSGR